MAVSNVYYTNMRTTLTENLLQKLERLVKKAGMMDIDFNNKYTAIKIHFGEPGNLAYLRANYSKVLVDLIRSQSGKVFLTDCNTLYVGRRKNALDHLDAAYENGYNPFTTGCHMIIADGLKGTDEALVPIDGEYVKEAKIGRAIMDADIVISLTHFKGHEATGFGGTLKNRAWEAAPEPARWRCTTPVSLLYIRINVSDAAPVRETAPTAPSRSLNAKPPLIQASVLDAAAVSEPVPWMRWTPCATRPMIY